MGKFDGVLLTSDFDNTLIHTEPCLRTGTPVPPLSAGNREALEYFMAQGGRFSVATGRALAAYLPVAQLVPVNAPCVICNGAAIYDLAAGEYLDFALLNEAVRPRVQQVLEAFPTVAVEAYHIDNVIHTVHPNDITRRHAHMTKVTTTECASMREVPLPLGKLLLEEERPVLEQAAAFIRDRGWGGDYELIFSGGTLLELTDKGASKGAMVLRLSRRLGIAREHIYCVGDEANDISMLTAARMGFAPENCAPDVRSCGARIVSPAWENALADVVSILDGIY